MNATMSQGISMMMSDPILIYRNTYIIIHKYLQLEY